MPRHRRSPAVPPPSRQPSLAEAERRNRGLGRYLAGGALSPELWRALGEGYLQGDRLADPVVAWVLERDTAHRRAELERAVRHGIAAIRRPPGVLRALFDTVESRPQWLDEAQLAAGARICQRAGAAGYYVLRDGGLMPGYLATAINQTLLLTGALQRGARRRMAETMKWWLDCTADGGMDYGQPGWRATLHVRLMHAFVRHRVHARPQWQADRWGLPVNQSDMAGTYLVFAVVFLLGLRMVGVPVSRAEGRAVMHFWRYVSWLIGVDDRWLVDSEAQGRRLLQHIVLSQPAPDHSSVLLGQALMNEPLQRHYDHFAWLRARLDRERHLSVTRLFVSRSQMRALGLPAGTLPWYPLALLPVNLARHLVVGALPGGRQQLTRAGRAAQEAIVQCQFGRERPAVGTLAAAGGGSG
jgi:hypothetical protein